MPSWLRGDVLDVRKIVSVWAAMNEASGSQYINTKVCPDCCHFLIRCHLVDIGSFRLVAAFGR